jgi:tetratricopeptide (TPR) repeat protein
MTHTTPLHPYQLVSDLLADYFRTKSHQGRITWLTDVGLSLLIPYLNPNQPTILFVPDLLIAAYRERSKRDDSLRQLLVQLREVYKEHPDFYTQVGLLLQEAELGGVLFPKGEATWESETTLRRGLVRFERLPTNSAQKVPEITSLPTPNYVLLTLNKDFVGRERELRFLAMGVKRGQVMMVVAGIGGVGKTQLVLEWVHRYGQFFMGGVFWLDFSDSNTAHLSIAAAGTAYRWPGYEGLDLEEQVEMVCRQWETSIPTLLIFDNCEDITLVQRYRPIRGGARVILTSGDLTWKEQDIGQENMQLEVMTLPRTDSTALLQQLHTALSQSDSDTIADLTGDLPMALQIAGHYLAKYQDAPFTYVERLKAMEESDKWRGDTKSPNNHMYKIRATFHLSWENLLAQEGDISTLVKTLLMLLAQFAPGKVVPEGWLRTGFPIGMDEQDWVEATKALRESGFIEFVDGGMFRLHPLIAEMTQQQTDIQAMTRIGICAEQILVEQKPTFGIVGFVMQMNLWLPHARFRSDYAEARGDEQGAALLGALGLCVGYIRLYEEAIHYTSKALSLSKGVLGKEHFLLLNRIGGLYESQGEQERALYFYEEALAIPLMEPEAQHADVAWCLTHLAELYESRGEYQRSLPLVEEALEIRKVVLGIRHSETATSLNHLAVLYQRQGEYGRALPLYEEALAIRKEMLGARHPITAQSLNNLAVLCERRGEYERALPLYEEALEIYKETLRTRHPDNASTLNNLAQLYERQGEYDRALPLYKEALAINKEVLGARHPTIAISLNNLAELYRVYGAHIHALPLYEEALSIRKEVLGGQHPDVANSLNNLALLYYQQEEYDRALRLLEEAFTIASATLGLDHPTTKICKENQEQCERALLTSKKQPNHFSWLKTLFSR